MVQGHWSSQVHTPRLHYCLLIAVVFWKSVKVKALKRFYLLGKTSLISIFTGDSLLKLLHLTSWHILSCNLGFPSPLTFLCLLLFSICGHSPRFILSSLTSGQYILLLLDEIYMSTEYRSFNILSSNVFTILFYNIHFCYKNLKTNKMDEIHKKC